MRYTILILMLTVGYGQDYKIHDGVWRGQEYADSTWKADFDTNLIYKPLQAFQGILFDYGKVITDSVVWELTDVDSLNMGDTTCDHIWEYSEVNTVKPSNIGCLVMHNGFHCSWRDGVQSRICSDCLRKETWQEQWYQHRYIPSETEYEKLEKKLKRKETQ